MSGPVTGRRELTCALWYYRYGHVAFDLCLDEDDAAHLAASIEEGYDDNADTVLGVQFRDGRLLPIKDWPAVTEHRRQMRAHADAARAQRAENPVPSREARDPFTRQRVRVWSEDGDWIGIPI